MAKCPFISDSENIVNCQEGNCQLWLEYCDDKNQGDNVLGECSLKLLTIINLPRFGAYAAPE
jgi:hypothetical protein